MQCEHGWHLRRSLESKLYAKCVVSQFRDRFSKIRQIRDGSDIAQALLGYLLSSLLRELAAVIHF